MAEHPELPVVPPVLFSPVPAIHLSVETVVPRGAAGYAPAGRYLWDSWVLQRGPGDYLLFHLDAPSDVPPEKRHDLAVLRQASSSDMQNWTDLGVTFEPGPEGSWDDKVVWSGNTYLENGHYYLFYTGRRRQSDPDLEQIQRIGLATSEDGIRWRRRDRPLLEPDGRYYETDEPSPVYKAWRDPAVIQDPDSGDYFMFFTARTKQGDPRYKGCIGLARARTIDGPYQVLPPVLAPGFYAEMECPQILQRQGKTYLFFSTFASNYHPEWAARVGAHCGLHCFVSDQLTGGYQPLSGNGLVEGLGDDSNLYGAHLAPDPQRAGEAVVIGWYMTDRDTAIHPQLAALPGGPAVYPGCQQAFRLGTRPLALQWRGEVPYVETSWVHQFMQQ